MITAGLSLRKLLLPRHPVTTAVLGDTLRGTPCVSN